MINLPTENTFQRPTESTTSLRNTISQDAKNRAEIMRYFREGIKLSAEKFPELRNLQIKPDRDISSFTILTKNHTSITIIVPSIMTSTFGNTGKPEMLRIEKIGNEHLNKFYGLQISRSREEILALSQVIIWLDSIIYAYRYKGEVLIGDDGSIMTGDGTMLGDLSIEGYSKGLIIELKEAFNFIIRKKPLITNEDDWTKRS